VADELQILRELIREHQSMVYSIALRICRNEGAAEEIAQDVFLELHRNMRKLTSAEHVQNWLRRVTTHRTLDWLRKRKCDPEQDAVEFDEGWMRVGWHAGAPSKMGSQLELLVRSLPEAHRVVIVMRYQEGLSAEEIAEVLRVPAATVKSQLQRALALLRRKGSDVLKEYVRG
jgi:RNA polymerase sigma-70 factor (ECF subfamily)